MQRRKALTKADWQAAARLTRLPMKRGPFVPKRTLGRPPMRPSATELKVIDTASAQYAADTTGAITLISGVATGTDYTNRIGRKVMLKTIQVQGTVYPVDDNTQSGTSRVMVVYDKQPTPAVALPVMTDILNTSDGDSYMNLNNRDRFVVMADIKIPVGRVLTSTTATQSLAYAVSPGIQHINIYRRINLEEIFSGTGATFASITSGQLLLVVVGTQAAGLGGQAQLTCRVRFADS